MRRFAQTTAALIGCGALSLLLHGLGIAVPWIHRVEHAPAAAPPTPSDGEIEVGEEPAEPPGSPDPPTPPAPPAPPPPKPPAAAKAKAPPSVAQSKPKEAVAAPEAELPTLPTLPAPEVADVTPSAEPATPGDANSVEAQRGRLGGAAACTDPVAGTWKATFFDGARSQWYAFTLRVKRSDAVLVGTIESKFWLGSRRSSRAPSSCSETPFYAVVSMPAQGVFGDGKVRFGARTWSLEHLYCGNERVQYTPDRFTGRIDLEKNEFQSIVTDGLNLIDQPLVLRRVGCGD